MSDKKTFQGGTSNANHHATSTLPLSSSLQVSGDKYNDKYKDKNYDKDYDKDFDKYYDKDYDKYKDKDYDKKTFQGGTSFANHHATSTLPFSSNHLQHKVINLKFSFLSELFMLIMMMVMVTKIQVLISVFERFLYI